MTKTLDRLAEIEGGIPEHILEGIMGLCQDPYVSQAIVGKVYPSPFGTLLHVLDLENDFLEYFGGTWDVPWDGDTDRGYHIPKEERPGYVGQSIGSEYIHCTAEQVSKDGKINRSHPDLVLFSWEEDVGENIETRIHPAVVLGEFDHDFALFHQKGIGMQFEITQLKDFKQVYGNEKMREDYFIIPRD